MRELFDPNDPKARAAPASYREQALVQDKQLLKIVWGEDYPKGFVQWSIRPYEQWYGCDGTTGGNIHLIAWRVCDALGLDYPALYEQAYDRSCDKNPCWLRAFDFVPYEAETIIPPLIPLTSEVLRGVLHDLHEINNHRLANLLEDTFQSLGYDVDYYWLQPSEYKAKLEGGEKRP